MNKAQPLLFCLGYGYTAQALARRLIPQGWSVLATTRSAEQAKAYSEMDGIEGIVFDSSTPIAIPQRAHWLISIPPDDQGCPAFRTLKAQAEAADWIGYLSTTGVYGDRGGDWVFEWSTPSPMSEQGERRSQAEQQWLSKGAQVFRLPGIYGPSRSAFDRLREGRARRIIKPGQVFSRVHVEDIASCLEASINRPSPRRVYHPCDDEPAPPQDVIEFAAELAGLPVTPDLPIDEANLSTMAQRFYSECKRVSNARTKAELGWRPTYSTYREGLAAILDAEQTPTS